MNKLLDIVSPDGYLYAIDKEAPIKDGDMSFDITTGEYHRTERGYGRLNLRVLVATNNSSLDIPKLPEVEDTISSFIKKLENQSFIGWGQGEEIGYKTALVTIKNHKAASKLYSEEDMRKAWEGGANEAAGTDDFPMAGNTFKYPTFDEFVKSLKPIPKQVEIEIEMDFDKMKGHESICKHFKPKVDSNNQVNVIRWI